MKLKGFFLLVFGLSSLGWAVGDVEQLQLIKFIDDSDESDLNHETAPKVLLIAPPTISLLTPRERFLKIREEIYQATMLHEIWHWDWSLPCKPPDCIPIKDLEKILGTSFSETEDL